jgi:hypothetical protein
MRRTFAIVGLNIASALFILSPSALADSASLSVSSPATVSLGDTFGVVVNISSVTNLSAYFLDLAFNPGVLSAMAITEGPFLSTGGPTSFSPGIIDNVGGTIRFNADALLETAVSGVSGNGTLIFFGFTAINPGTSSLTIESEALQDPFGALISATVTSGSVTVQGTAPVPEPSALMLLLTGSAVLGFALKKGV